MRTNRLNGAPPMRPDEAYDHGTPPTFEEKVNALAGRGSWRTPSDGAQGGVIRITPGEHLDAAALAYARQERGDFGPDVVIAVALQSDAKRSRCVHALAEALAAQTRAKDERPLLYASMCAWDFLVHGTVHKAPAAMPGRAWDALLKLAVAVLDGERHSALAAARRVRRAA